MTRGVGLSVVAIIALLSGCKDEPPATPPRKVKKKVDTNRIPAPNHSPQQLMDPGKPRRVSQKGTMEADLSGRRQHFSFFPRGSNAAVHNADTGVSWMKLEGALTDEGKPSLLFQLEPYKLAPETLPATFVAGQAKEGEPALTVTYSMGPNEQWSSKVESDAPMRLTIESLEGRTVSGTFEGTLNAMEPNQSDPVQVAKGTFAIDIRRRNVGTAKVAE
jgi:hypothetical protein